MKNIIQEVIDDAQMLYTKKDVIELLKKQKIENLEEQLQYQLMEKQRQLINEFINVQADIKSKVR